MFGGCDYRAGLERAYPARVAGIYILLNCCRAAVIQTTAPGEQFDLNLQITATLCHMASPPP